MQRWSVGALLGLVMLLPSAQASVEDDLKTVLPMGPRVAGSAANEQARTYFERQFQALGYTTRRDTFSYPRFDDLGTDVRLGTQTFSSLALQGSAGGSVTARAVHVPGVGNPDDFSKVAVRGQIAVVQRGEIPFLAKAEHALQAGALGLIVVNQEDEPVQGVLGRALSLPAVTVTRAVGASLQDGQTLTLNVRVRDGEVQGVNVVAFKSGVTQPAIVFGGHLDSVSGSPGANDNLSGTAAVVELARRAVNTPLSQQSVFVLFDGEEDGLHGSRAFVRQQPALVQGLKAMFNFDMVGVNVTPLRVTGEPSLVQTARQAALLPGSSPAGSGSDHVPFAQAGVPTLFFHRGLDANYHKPTDTQIDAQLIYSTVNAALKTAQATLRLPAATR